MDTTPNDLQRENLRPLAVACPSAPDGCGSPAGQLCTSHGGTRVRNSQVHRARTAAWEAARLAANPAAKLIFDAAKERRGMHSKHAAELLDAQGYTDEAEQIRHQVTVMHGHLYANQAALWLIERTEDGESR